MARLAISFGYNGYGLLGCLCSCRVARYLDFLRKRASGDILTAAQWMREYVAAHPDYKHDSVVSDRVAYDLLERIDAVAQGKAGPC